MTIQQYIEVLQELKEKHGDLPVFNVEGDCDHEVRAWRPYFKSAENLGKIWEKPDRVIV